MRISIKATLRYIYRHLPLPAKTKYFLREKLYLFILLPKRLHRLITQKKIQPPFVLPLANPDLPDILVFAVIDWSFRIQRPQHIAKALAQKGHRVFYISNNFKNDSTTEFYAQKLDKNLPLYLINLPLIHAPAIYSHAVSNPEFQQLTQGLANFLGWLGYRKTLSILDHAFWTQLAFILPNNYVIYDCMDHHAGFADTAPIVIANEKILFQKADLILTSSQKLYETACVYNPTVSLIRNAADYDYFKNPPKIIYTDAKNRKIIGYYGAIAEWFDLTLIEKLALACPNDLILLIGNDTITAEQKLKKYHNIIFTGEVVYSELPYYLYAFDVCLIPFKINTLTEATNPVKVYEYLSAGKPVISVDLPEVRIIEHHVDIAVSYEDFIAKTKARLHQPGDTQSRQAFASQQTWAARIDNFEKSLQKISSPLVSIIVLTYNNLKLTKACLDSIEKYTDYPNYEVIIVDNASTDRTPDYLKTLSSHYKIILNADNKGFSAGNNTGLKATKGDYVVILNNDTEVTPGWLKTMVNHCKYHPNIGLLGPMTNNIGNEAKLITHYQNTEEMLTEAHKNLINNMGELIPMKTIAFFCVMIPRKIVDQVGLLDEQFGLGFFEDDDYCRRVEKTGHEIFCAKDVFIHHHLSASFNKMSNKKRASLFEKNKLLYEKKWGVWQKHHIPIEEKIAATLAVSPRLSITPHFIRIVFYSFITLIFLTALGIFDQRIKTLWNYTVDDAFISLRYSYHLIHYGKILWNPSRPPIEGYTSFLHIILLSLGFFTHSSILVWSKLLSILALLGVGLIMLRSILHSKNSFFITTLSVLSAFLLTDTVTAIHAIAGLETGLYFLLLFFSSALFFSINNTALPFKIFSWRVFLFSLVALLTGLTRPEANLYEFIFIVATSMHLKQLRLSYFLKNIMFIYAIPGALYFTWRWIHYGLFLPLPFYIKFNHGVLFPGLPDVKLFLHYYWPLLFTMVIFWIGGFKHHKIIVIAYLSVFISGLLFSVYANPIMDYAFRFSWPLIAFVLSSAWVIADKPEKNLFFYAAITILASGIFIYKNHNAAHDLEIQSIKYSAGLEKAHITLGKSLSTVFSQQPLVTCDAGAIPFYSHWPVIDSCALNNKILATTSFSPIQKANYILTQNPRIIILISTSAKTMQMPLLAFEKPLYNNAIKLKMQLLKLYQFQSHYYLWVMGYPDDKAIIFALKGTS